MHQNIIKEYNERLSHFLKFSEEWIYPEFIMLDCEMGISEDPVPFHQRLNLSYRTVKEGEVWGKAWDSAWFHVTGSVPENFADKEICLRFNAVGESLLFDEQGVPVYGLTGGSAMDIYYRKERFVIGNKKAGEKVEFWIESSCSQLFGISLPDAYSKNPPAPYGKYAPVLDKVRLCIFDRELWHFRIELQGAWKMLSAIPENDYRYKLLLNAVNRSLDIYNYDTANLPAARQYLKDKVYSKTADSTALSVIGIGHAHIDVGWLWPVRESIRKSARTFSSQLALMEEYPDYVFGASQAELYAMVKENYPELYEKIKLRIKEGRWEVQGGMWVEADCNLISGESMVRQFLYGKNFFMDEFGVDVKNLWLPDVFGYSAAMPQIIRKSGCDSFLTQKLSWSRINGFPHHTFLWKGLDGTEVITHFPPENTYNSYAEINQRIKAQNDFHEAGFLPEFISLFGIGDGGGGPSEEYIERNNLQKNLMACPKLTYGRADDFFVRLAEHKDELAVWDGELYLECHRGTLTSQARTKRYNRRCEQGLIALEMLCSMLPPEEYPVEMLKRAWRIVLRNQFHDILPGSSINKVYQVAEQEYGEVLQMIDAESRIAADKLFRKAENHCVVVNTLSIPYQGTVVLPDSWTGATLDDQVLPAQKSSQGKTFVQIKVPANGFLTLKTGTQSAAVQKLSNPVLENDLIRYEFSANGTLLSVKDKKSGQEFLAGEGNLLKLYNDTPNRYDAWDIDIYYKNMLIGILPGEFVSGESGAVYSELKFLFKTENSQMEQTIRLANDTVRLDFINHVNWQESHKLLRVTFPVAIRAQEATYDIQYGSVKRSTHDNTSWEQAKYEVCGQRFADLSDRQNGVALLNDCKYGYSIKNNEMELSLLRSPKHPDYFADQGEHEFTYSFFPHSGDVVSGGVMEQAACLNRMPLMLNDLAADNLQMPCRIESEHVRIEVLKKAEKNNALILRLVETAGMNSPAKLYCTDTIKKVFKTNLIEWEQGEVLTPTSSGEYKVTLKPFEIMTLCLNQKV